MSLHTLKPRLVILTEILLASGVLLCGALKILPFDSVSMLIVMGTASVWLRNEGLRGIGLDRHGLGLKIVLLSSAFGVFYQAVSLVVLDPLAAHLTGVTQDLSNFAVIRGNSRLLMRYLIVVWIVAAFGEEFVFRGYLLNRIAQLQENSHAARWMGVVFSSILWTFVHFYQGVAGAMLIAVHGVVFGGLYVLAGRNLWVTIVVHGVYDTTALLLIFFGRYPNLGS